MNRSVKICQDSSPDSSTPLDRERLLMAEFQHPAGHLAPYATSDSYSGRRKFPELSHAFRTDFQRDRDRILHSKAFRRLEYKTQVFLNGTGDHYRTRLTHTIEVAAIARTIARALGLNEDLTECIALAHDLGHTPFGHSGERALQKIMADHGGFDHNLQALRIVDLLEVKYPDHNGLNLTWETRNGLVKHRYDSGGNLVKLDGEILTSFPSAESQIADVADDLTYYGHDVDDGLDSGLITLEMLEELPIWNLCAEKAEESGIREKNDRYCSYTVRCLIDAMVGDVIRTSRKKLQAVSGREEIFSGNAPVISFSEEFKTLTDTLREFLYHNLYFHKELEKLNDLSYDQMETLFRIFTGKPALMGENAVSRIASEGLERTAADFIAGMTDTFAMSEFQRLTALEGVRSHGSI